MPVKYVNVVDPLLPSNNLGRSVSQGNAIRIRKAFKTGAARLSALRRDEGSRDEAEGVRVLEAFFGNALRHRRGTRALPSAPKTPGGRDHADEVSMTAPQGGFGGADDAEKVAAVSRRVSDASAMASKSEKRRRREKKAALASRRRRAEEGGSDHRGVVVVGW